VLVVDDDAGIRSFLTVALEDAGYEVRAAADGVEALGVLGAWRPGAVLLDLWMPRMDGWEFCERLAARPDLDGVAVVAMSAAANLRRPIRGAQPAATLEKPLDLPELLATLWVATNP
jgi:two-component system nitrogen regulation response regulator NtrX